MDQGILDITIVATRHGEQFLIDIGEGKGRVFDVQKNELYEAFSIDDIISRGLWTPTTTSLAADDVVGRIAGALGIMGFEAIAEISDAPEVTSDDGPGEFSLTLLDESKPTIDGRSFVPGKVTWRDPPIPLMFTTTNTHEGHKGSIAGGSITSVMREGTKIIGKGVFDSGENGQELRRMISEGTLTGVSSDVGGAIQEESLGENGLVNKTIMEGRIMGATVLPFQAFDDTRIAVTAAAAVPDTPPREWFAKPTFDGPTPLTVTADGQVYGHAAIWGTCHIGKPGQCLTPPKSRSGYAHFTTGTVVCADGQQVAVGPITLGTGHAGLSLAARPAAEHYDHTGAVVADVAAGEDTHGIWVAGALRPNLEPGRVRELRASALSGDWRAVGGALELVALLAVNTPGFPIPRVTTRFEAEHQMALVAAGIPGNEIPEEVAAEEVVVAAITDEVGDCVECGADEPDLVELTVEGGEELSAEETAEYTARLDKLETAILALAAQSVGRREFSTVPSWMSQKIDA